MFIITLAGLFTFVGSQGSLSDSIPPSDRRLIYRGLAFHDRVLVFFVFGVGQGRRDWRGPAPKHG